MPDNSISQSIAKVKDQFAMGMAKKGAVMVAKEVLIEY